MRRFASGEDIPISPWRIIRLDTPGERYRILPGSYPHVMFVMQGGVTVINGVHRGSAVRQGEMAVVPAHRTCTVGSTELSYIMACRFDPKGSRPEHDIRDLVHRIMESVDDTGIIRYDRRVRNLISQVHDIICNGILDLQTYNDARDELTVMLYAQINREKASRWVPHLPVK